MEFEWDENKNLKNREKHKIGFEEAKTIFDDPNSIELEATDRNGEYRIIRIGKTTTRFILLVLYTIRGLIVRLISARQASKKETFILSINLKMREMKVLTIKEAVDRINNGGNLEGILLDKSTMQQVNVRDAMVLSRGGVVIPEQNIYYNDDDIEYDEDIDELTITSGILNLSWEEKIQKAEAFEKQRSEDVEVMVNLSTRQPEIDDWIVKNKKKIEKLLKPIVISLFDAEKM